MVKIVKTQKPIHCEKGFVLIDNTRLVVLGHSVNIDSLSDFIKSPLVQALCIAVLFLILGFMMGCAL